MSIIFHSSGKRSAIANGNYVVANTNFFYRILYRVDLGCIFNAKYTANYKFVPKAPNHQLPVKKLSILRIFPTK